MRGDCETTADPGSLEGEDPGPSLDLKSLSGRACDPIISSA